MIFSERRVVFFQVRDNKSKIARIVETAHHHFEKKEKLLIIVEDAKAQLYVDELLWKTPPYGFLPHVASDESVEDWIVITKLKQNLNGAKFAFNLCSTPLLIDGSFRIIYDFEDLTAPNKQSLSTVRYDAYKQSQFSIVAKP